MPDQTRRPAHQQPQAQGRDSLEPGVKQGRAGELQGPSDHQLTFVNARAPAQSPLGKPQGRLMSLWSRRAAGRCPPSESPSSPPHPQVPCRGLQGCWSSLKLRSSRAEAAYATEQPCPAPSLVPRVSRNQRIPCTGDAEAPVCNLVIGPGVQTQTPKLRWSHRAARLLCAPPLLPTRHEHLTRAHHPLAWPRAVPKRAPAQKQLAGLLTLT